MAKIYLMRHSSTYYNDLDMFAGKLDIPLSKNGILKTIEIAQTSNALELDYVLTSCMSRSIQTALIFLSFSNMSKIPILVNKNKKKINESLLPVIKYKELNERNYGLLENRIKQDVEQEYGENLVFDWRRNFNATPPKGESFEDVVERVRKVYCDLITLLEKDKNILIVAHQNTLRALWYLFFNIDNKNIEEIEFDNNEISCLEYNNKGFKVLYEKNS